MLYATTNCIVNQTHERFNQLRVFFFTVTCPLSQQDLGNIQHSRSIEANHKSSQESKDFILQNRNHTVKLEAQAGLRVDQNDFNTLYYILPNIGKTLEPLE